MNNPKNRILFRQEVKLKGDKTLTIADYILQFYIVSIALTPFTLIIQQLHHEKYSIL